MNANNGYKVKLIVPPYFEIREPYNYIPIYCLPYGMGILTAFLRQHSYYVEQEDFSVRFNRYDNDFLCLRFKNKDLDMNRNIIEIRRFLEYGEIDGRLSSFIDKVLDSVRIESFDLMGFSILSFYNFLSALMLSKRIKQNTNIPIVFGGAFISLYGHLYPKAFNIVDYMIVGDGRVPLLRLIGCLQNKITLSEVPNLIYRDNGKLISNRKEDYPLEDVPIPDFTDLPIELYKNKYADFSKYNIQLPYQISSGCSSRCNFCVHRYINDKLECKSYDKVISELRQMQAIYKSNIFYLCDSSINNSYEYLEGLCDLFIKHKLNISWRVYAKMGNLDKHILRKMREAGCYRLIFGIESGSDRMLEMMNKGFTSEQASKTLKDASEAGIGNAVFFLTGYPYETQEDISRTKEFIRGNKRYINYVFISIFQLYYGCALYSNPERYDITNVAPVYFRPFCFSFDEFNGLKWEQKQKQQEDSQRQIIKAIHKNIGFCRYIKLLFFRGLYYLKMLFLKLKEYVG